MKRQLRFLHAADLHLGAPFRGFRALSDAWADRLTRAIPEAYERVIETAITERVDFVVIAGDVFDSGRPSYANFLQFFRGIERLRDAGIPVYFCTGNHDPATSWKQNMFAMPDNAVMFSADKPSFILHERDGEPLCILAGRGYPFKVWSREQNIAEGMTRRAAERALGGAAAEAPFAVGVLHTGLHIDRTKAATDPSALRWAGFDYWALGHIHKHWVDDPFDPRLVFSGCIQGRDIRETGRRGVTLVTLTEDEPNRIEFVPTASVAWEQIVVDATGLAGIPDLISAILEEQFRANGASLCEEMVTRVTLVGATDLHEALVRPGVLEDIRNALNEQFDSFYCDTLIDLTTVPINREALRAEGLFPATFLSTSETLRADEGALNVLLQAELFARGVDVASLPLRNVEALAQEAEDMVLDLLLRGEGR